MYNVSEHRTAKRTATNPSAKLAHCSCLRMKLGIYFSLFASLSFSSLFVCLHFTYCLFALYLILFVLYLILILFICSRFYLFALFLILFVGFLLASVVSAMPRNDKRKRKRIFSLRNAKRKRNSLFVSPAICVSFKLCHTKQILVKQFGRQ